MKINLEHLPKVMNIYGMTFIKITNHEEDREILRCDLL